MNRLPERFADKFKEILGSDFSRLEQSYNEKPSKGLWANSHKIASGKLKEKLELKGWKLEQLEFNENAFRLAKSPDRPGLTGEFEYGLFNLQDIAAMVPAVLLNPEEGASVLDCCAAPGTKTLQLSTMMKGTGHITAFDEERKRYKALKTVVIKFGAKNVNAIHQSFLSTPEGRKFKFILLDAPCSGEGFAVKMHEAMKAWSPAAVKRKSELQKRMILRAFDLLETGGKLVYSVCTMSPEECEEVVQRLVEKRPEAELVKLEIKGLAYSEGLRQYNGKDFSGIAGNCMRIWPWQNNTQGFFIAVIGKKSFQADSY